MREIIEELLGKYEALKRKSTYHENDYYSGKVDALEELLDRMDNQ